VSVHVRPDVLAPLALLVVLLAVSVDVRPDVLAPLALRASGTLNAGRGARAPRARRRVLGLLPREPGPSGIIGQRATWADSGGGSCGGSSFEIPNRFGFSVDSSDTCWGPGGWGTWSSTTSSARGVPYAEYVAPNEGSSGYCERSSETVRACLRDTRLECLQALEEMHQLAESVKRVGEPIPQAD
jgi:hypothetical protein